MKMKISKKLLYFTFLSLIISCVARLESHISVSPTSSGGHSHSPDTDHVDPMVKKWCSSTDYPDICIATIGSSLRGKPELYSALEVAIKSSVEITKVAISVVRKITVRLDLKPVLKDSMSSFSDALDNFKQAQDALPQRDWGTVNTMLSGAMSDFGDCEDFLSGHNVPALNEFIQKLKKMTSNCLALSSLLNPQPMV